MKLEHAQEQGNLLVSALAKFCLPKMCMVVGSTRRLVDEPGDLELLCCPDLNGHPRLEFGKPAFSSFFDQALHGMVEKNILTPTNKGNLCRKYYLNSSHSKLQIWVLYDPSLWGVCATVYTGPADFSKWVVTQRQFGGALPDGHRITDGWKLYDMYQSRITVPTEGEFLEFLGLGWVEPKDRRANMRKWK